MDKLKDILLQDEETLLSRQIDHELSKLTSISKEKLSKNEATPTICGDQIKPKEAVKQGNDQLILADNIMQNDTRSADSNQGSKKDSSIGQLVNDHLLKTFCEDSQQLVKSNELVNDQLNKTSQLVNDHLKKTFNEVSSEDESNQLLRSGQLTNDYSKNTFTEVRSLNKPGDKKQLTSLCKSSKDKAESFNFNFGIVDTDELNPKERNIFDPDQEIFICVFKLRRLSLNVCYVYFDSMRFL